MARGFWFFLDERRATDRATRTGSVGAAMTKVGVVKFSGSSVGGMISEDTQEGKLLETDDASLVFAFACFFPGRSLRCCWTRFKRGMESSFRCVRRVNGWTAPEATRASAVG